MSQVTFTYFEAQGHKIVNLAGRTFIDGRELVPGNIPFTINKGKVYVNGKLFKTYTEPKETHVFECAERGRFNNKYVVSGVDNVEVKSGAEFSATLTVESFGAKTKIRNRVSVTKSGTKVTKSDRIQYSKLVLVLPPLMMQELEVASDMLEVEDFRAPLLRLRVRGNAMIKGCEFLSIDAKDATQTFGCRDSLCPTIKVRTETAIVAILDCDVSSSVDVECSGSGGVVTFGKIAARAKISVRDGMIGLKNYSGGGCDLRTTSGGIKVEQTGDVLGTVSVVTESGEFTGYGTITPEYQGLTSKNMFVVERTKRARIVEVD